MEAAAYKIERRIVRQEQLVVQIATEAAHMKIELEDLKKASLPRQSVVTISESGKDVTFSESVNSRVVPEASSLQLDLPMSITKTTLGSQRTMERKSLYSADTAKDRAGEGVDLPTPFSSPDGGSNHKILNKPNSKSAATLVSNSENIKKARMKLLNGKTGTRMSTGSDETQATQATHRVPDMMDGALGLRKKFKNKIFNAVMVPEQNTTIIFVKTHPFRGMFRRVTEQPVFEIVFGCFVMASAILIGVETEAEATDSNHNATPYVLAQSVCAMAFVFEIVVRLISYGPSFFGVGTGRVAKDWKWNMFDLVCLVTTIADIFCDIFILDSRHELITTFRQFRIIRASRVIRTLRFAREFRKMSYALQYSGSTLLWALITLSCVIFFFATALTRATTEHLNSFNGGELDKTAILLRDFYGTMPQSFHSLFQAVSGGRDWYELIQPLMEIGWILPALLLAYIALTIFGVMNVLTSVFVESAVASYQHYKDILIQENLSSMQVYIEHLKEIFVQIDFDNSGEISIDELEVFLNDPSLQQYLESIDVHPDDARTLFRLLDRDNSGFINIDEFCNGCLRLKGEAKSFDIHCIIYENERLMHKFQEFIAYLERGFLAKIDKNVDRRIGQWPPLTQPLPPSALPASALPPTALTPCVEIQTPINGRGTPPPPGELTPQGKASDKASSSVVFFEDQCQRNQTERGVVALAVTGPRIRSHDEASEGSPTPLLPGLPEIGKDIPAKDPDMETPRA